MAMASATGPDINNEDYNIRSPERTRLLTKIKEVIGGANISPTFWACCQLADIERLEAMAQLPPYIIFYFEELLCVVPMRCEPLGQTLVNMLTVNRDSAIPGFGIPWIRGGLTTFRRSKDA